MNTTTICQDVDSLSSQWAHMQDSINMPTCHYDWVAACMEFFAKDAHPYLLITEDKGVPVAIAPLVKNHAHFGLLEYPGGNVHGEPVDFVYKDRAALDSLTHTLARAKIPLHLSRVPMDSPVTESIIQAYAHNAFILCHPRASNPYICISGNAEETLAQLPKRIRADLRRARNKAKRLGQVRFEIHAPTDAESLAPLLEEATRIEASGWKGRSHTALQTSPVIGPFMTAYAKRACQQGCLRIAFLHIGSCAVAMQLAVVYSNRLWLLKIGYDEAFASCSPGMLLMEETLSYAAGHGMASYEFFGRAADWTRRWTKSESNNITLRTFPYSLRGLACLADYGRQRLSRKMDRLQARIKRHG